VNVGRRLQHTTVRYRMFATYFQNDYTGEAGSVMGEENRGLTLNRSPYIQRV